MTSNGYDTFSSIPALKAAAAAAGNPWFSKGAMQFFGSRIETGIIRGSYFVTSEAYEDEPRLFTVRRAARHEDGTLEISTVGEFQGYKTKEEARAALMAAANES